MSAGQVCHFGPDASEVGGMASVIRVLTENRVGAENVAAHATWRRGSFGATLRLCASALATLARLPRQTVVHVHLSEGGSFVREGLILRAASARGLGTVATLHGAEFLPFARRHDKLVRGVLTAASVVICLDDEVLEHVRRVAPAVKSLIVPNPVRMDPDAVKADETGELVMFAGEISLRKGADVMHRAWRRIAEQRPEARCLMVGPEAGFAVPQTQRLEVRGPVDSDQMRELMRQARVVVLPSRAEGMPMVLTEAMSCGRPFVSTPVGGVPLLRDGGILVSVGDDAGLAERISDLLADPALARRIGDRAREFCASTRSVSVVDTRLRELYAHASQGRLAEAGFP